MKVDRDRLAALPRIPRDEDGPVFAEPWQAQAFALAVKLSEDGYFTWKEWAAALAERKAAWADAYRHTPHGKPVELRRRRPTPDIPVTNY